MWHLFEFSEMEEDLLGSREADKSKQLDASRRENILVMRLASKEQEMQEYMVCCSVVHIQSH